MGEILSLPENITIARVIARLNVGGPAIQAILMTDVFRRRGYGTLLLTGEVAEGEASMEYLAEANHVVPIKLNTMSRRISLFRDSATLWRLIRILRREKPFIIHTHTAKAGTLGRLAAIAARVPIRVHTFHGHVFDGYFSRLMTHACLMIERALGWTTDRIVAVSESQRKELTDLYRVASADKIVAIPLGFNLEPFLAVRKDQSLMRAAIGCSTDGILAGWVGRLTPIKAPKLLLDCAALARDAGVAASFVLVGDGELRSACESQIYDEQLGQIVRILGWQRDLPAIYAGLDLVISTSVNEGTPVALLEAMASGCPFVATDVGGVCDLMVGAGKQMDGMTVFKNGILVPRDANVLSRAVRYLAGNAALRKEMGLAGRAFVREQFSYARLADDLEELYLSIAREKGYFLYPSDSDPHRRASLEVVPLEIADGVGSTVLDDIDQTSSIPVQK